MNDLRPIPTLQPITEPIASTDSLFSLIRGYKAQDQARKAQEAAESLLGQLAKVGQPTYVDQCRAFTEDEIDAMEQQDQEQRLLMNEATAQWERTHGRFDPV